MSKTRGLVLEGYSPRTPLGTAAPALSLPDMSRFGNNGVFTDVTWVQLPSGLWVMSCNGASSVVNLGAGVFDTLEACTVEFWYAPNAPLGATTNMLWGFFTDIDNNWGGEYDRGNFYFYATIGGGAVVFIVSVGDAGMSFQWHHWASCFGIGGAEFWLDGVSMGTDVSTESVTDIAPTLVNCFGEYGNGSLYWAGYIAPPRVYNYALSADEINKHFEAERRLFGV